MIRLADTLGPMADFPVALAEHIQFEDGDTLQKKFNEEELGGGDNSLTITQEEYDNLSMAEQLDGLYYTYDTKRIYKNGIQYGANEPIELTVDEFKALKEAGALDEKQEYIITTNENGTLLEASDIGYNGATSGLSSLSVQGSIDEVNDKIDNIIDDENVNENTVSTWSSSKIAEELNKKSNTTTRSLTLNSGYSGYITEIYDPTTKVVVYNININGTFKGLGNSIATGFKIPNTASSGADVMVSTIGIYGAINTLTGDAQFTRLLIRSYGNPFLDVDAQGNFEISGTITYIAQ